MIRSPILLLTSVASSLPFVACHTQRGPSLRDADYPGTLQQPTQLPVEAVWQQRVTASWQVPGQPAQERGFDAAVQRQGDKLTVVGLSPMGSIGFSIQQGPDGIDVTNNIPEQMVIPPRFILLDVQRTFFPWFAETGYSGERAMERDGERITERWEQGQLAERSFVRTDGKREGTIRIRYEWSEPDPGGRSWVVPHRAMLDNGWFGYRLTIATSSETRLQPEDAR